MDQDLASLARKYFKINLPCTADALKSAYRREAKTCHPDIHPGDPASEDYFKKMQQAYEILNSKPEILQSPDVEASPKTVDGILLSELGLGYEEGGSPCGSCNSKGYTTIQADPYIICRQCSGVGFTVRCPHCIGTGKGAFGRQKSCRSCSGTGRIGLTSARGDVGFRACHACNGRGGFKASKPVFHHYKCGDCEGKGQRKMFNPLWPKMRVGR